MRECLGCGWFVCGKFSSEVLVVVGKCFFFFLVGGFGTVGVTCCSFECELIVCQVCMVISGFFV